MSPLAVREHVLGEQVREAMAAFGLDPNYLVSMARNSQRAEVKRVRLEQSRSLAST